MKQLLIILLLFPLFIACSSDDDDKKEEGLTDAQKEAFLVGQWSNTIGAPFVYYFGDNRQFQKYEIVSISNKTIRKSTDTGSSGTYSVEGNYIKVAGTSTLFSIKDENTIAIGVDFTRDDTEYTIIQ